MTPRTIDPLVLIVLATVCSVASQVVYWRLYNRERERALAEGRHTVRSWPGTHMRRRALRSPLIVGLMSAAVLLLVAALVLLLTE